MGAHGSYEGWLEGQREITKGGSMSTEYNIYSNKKDCFSVLEHSNKFDLIIDEKEAIEDHEDDYNSINDLSEDELLQAALKIIQVCSYFMDTNDLKEKVNQFIEKEIY